MKTKYPQIWDACFYITIDNGGLNRERSEEQIDLEFDAFIMGVEENETWDLQKINDWIGTLSRKSTNEFDSQFEILCAGEETEMEALLNGSPIGTQELLNRWFEDPC